MINLLCASWFSTHIWLFVLVGVLAVAITLFCVFVPFKTWVKALVSKAYIRAGKLSSMKLRKLDYVTIADTYITARRAGIRLDITDLEIHHISKGNIDAVVEALIVARDSGLNVSIDTIKAIDLTGKDVVGVVKAVVTPKVVDVPAVSAVTKDNYEVKLVARITLRTNLRKFIGGATEETMVDRVREGLVSMIGGADKKDELLENPDIISRGVMAKRLSIDSAYDLVSIDIVDIKVVKDFNQEREEYEMKKARMLKRAQAEEKELMAKAYAEQLRVKAREKEIERLSAEAEVPKMIMKAFNDGKMSVMDYYKMQNMIADTNMRNALAKEYQSADEEDDDEEDDE